MTALHPRPVAVNSRPRPPDPTPIPHHGAARPSPRRDVPTTLHRRDRRGTAMRVPGPTRGVAYRGHVRDVIGARLRLLPHERYPPIMLRRVLLCVALVLAGIGVNAAPRIRGRLHRAGLQQDRGVPA